MTEKKKTAEELLEWLDRGTYSLEVIRLAREAIALLREQQAGFDLEHGRDCKLILVQKWTPGDPTPVCSCGVWDYERRCDLLLESGGKGDDDGDN